MAEADTGAAPLKLLGGRLCLDLANTVDWRTSDRPEERLASYQDLVAWSRQAGILGDDEVQLLLAAAQERPVEARAALQRAIALREAIYRLFSAIAQGQPVMDADLATLSTVLAEAAPRLHLVPQQPGAFAWTWAGAADALDRMLWPVARSAADLLTSAMLGQVHQCAGDGCGWLFLDTSRNHSRRWCTMDDCGNRAKARRHYRRTREAQEAENEGRGSRSE